MRAAEQKLISNLFPAGVITVVGDGSFDHDLFPEEEEVVANSLEKRRLEYAQGRGCARLALRRLGVDPVPILARADRAPIWPEGVIGTITHTAGLVAAAVAMTSEVSGIGLDAESRAYPMKAGLDRLIRTPAERQPERALPEELDPVRLVFSAKESVHKCVSPSSGVRLGFQDVELEFDIRNGRFRAILLARHHQTLPDFDRIEGRFAISPDYVLTSTTIAAAPAPVLPNSPAAGADQTGSPEAN